MTTRNQTSALPAGTWAFIIDSDYVSSPSLGEKSMRGKGGATTRAVDLRAVWEGIEKTGRTPRGWRRFRLKDDDGEVYFLGFFSGDWESEDGFGPLDNFGAGWGCTSIEYRNERGAWEVL